MTNALSWTTPGPVASAFLRDDASFVRGLRGPVGSGKSVACCIEIVRKACQQKPNAKNLRRSRWAVVRNTAPELKTTTIKSWRDWIDDSWGKFNWSPPYTHNVRFALGDGTTVELEVLFVALDKPDDVKKMLSLELTGAWINEAREVSKDIVDAVSMRVGRFPAMRDGGPSWFGVIMDTNAPGEDHWWGILAGEVPIPEYMTEDERRQLVKPQGWTFYTQPPAMLEHLDDQGRVDQYSVNPDAENRANLDPQYYPRIITGKGRGWIRCYILNRYETLTDGKAVYPTFRPEAHVADRPIEPDPHLEIGVGIDFGRTPAAVFTQLFPGGRWSVFHELCAQDMGAGRFAELLKREIARMGWAHLRFRFVGDPAGSALTQADETTPFMVMRTNGIHVTAAPSNDPELRIEAVEQTLNRMVDGKPALLVSPTCTTVKAGFEGGYQFRRLQVSGREQYEDKPTKNRFSHPHDALQYIVLAGGEGKRVTTGRAGPSGPVKARTNWNPFQRRGMHRRRSGAA